MAAELQGKVALVTGAARGQGRSHALRLAEEGANVVAIDLCGQVDTVPYDMSTEDDLQSTVKLVEGTGSRILSAVVDARDASAMQEIADRGVEEFGHLDIVCANAGIWSAGGIRDVSTDAWEDMLAINLTGAFHTAKATVEHLVASGGGSFIATSSVFGLKGRGGIVAYTAAKHGVSGLVRDMAAELAPHCVRVNSIHPGSVDTAMVRNEYIYKLFRPEKDHPVYDDAKAGISAMNALPIDLMSARDISEMVVFLASDRARYITGTSIPVDAGFMQL